MDVLDYKSLKIPNTENWEIFTVTFSLMEETKERLVFRYFPEGREDRKPGIIVVDRATGETEIAEVAQEDREHDISPEEINELVEKLNQIKRELGTTDFAEPVTEPVHSIYYADRAAHEIKKNLREGRVPVEGKAVW